MRLLFASVHGYIDPSSGAATTTRDLWELLASRGHDCRVLSTGVLDYRRETPLEGLLDRLGASPRRVQVASAGSRSPSAIDLSLGGVRALLLPTSSSRIERFRDGAEPDTFLDLAEQVFERFRPEILLTYGGDPTNLKLMRKARRRGIPVAFHLHNLDYSGRRAFEDASAVLVPSEYARRYYARRLGVASTAIHPPLNPERIAAEGERRYLTFVNPEPAKGLPVFARIASELDRSHPEIPILIVEGRSTAEALAYAGIDLSKLSNLNRIENTPEPKDFYRATRALLAPSLCREAFGRVVAEALLNGIPVLASDRGALPEALGDAGFAFTLPERCTSSGALMPAPEEIAPWIATIRRLWNDPVFEAKHRSLARAAAHRWESDRIAGEYESFFGGLASGPPH